MQLTEGRHLQSCQKRTSTSWADGSIIGHVGDGNFHETILFNGDGERRRVEDCVHKMVDRAMEVQGTCTVSRNPLKSLFDLLSSSNFFV